MVGQFLSILCVSYLVKVLFVSDTLRDILRESLRDNKGIHTSSFLVRHVFCVSSGLQMKASCAPTKENRDCFHFERKVKMIACRALLSGVGLSHFLGRA